MTRKCKRTHKQKCQIRIPVTWQVFLGTKSAFVHPAEKKPPPPQQKPLKWVTETCTILKWPWVSQQHTHAKAAWNLFSPTVKPIKKKAATMGAFFSPLSPSSLWNRKKKNTEQVKERKKKRRAGGKKKVQGQLSLECSWVFRIPTHAEHPKPGSILTRLSQGLLCDMALHSEAVPRLCRAYKQQAPQVKHNRDATSIYLPFSHGFFPHYIRRTPKKPSQQRSSARWWAFGALRPRLRRGAHG